MIIICLIIYKFKKLKNKLLQNIIAKFFLRDKFSFEKLQYKVEF